MRELYHQLGVALLRGRRYSEAVGALQRAREESGESPPDAEIVFHLARAHERAGDASKALRTYLEAGADAPLHLSRVLDRAHQLLSTDSALAQGPWIVGEWQGQVARRAAKNDLELMKLALFVGRVHLFQADYERAIERFREAVALAPEATGEAAWFLEPEALPPAFQAPRDGVSYLELARIHAALTSAGPY
jgi:tetratricopeptide (TPR) repeat protein